MGQANTIIYDSFIFVKRKWWKYLNNPGQIGLTLLRPILLLFVFSLLFGKAISGSVASYQTIIVPGMVIFASLSSASTSTSMLMGDFSNGVFDRFRTLAISRVSPMAGALAAEIPIYFLNGAALLLLGVLLGYRPEGTIWEVILGLVLMTFFTWAHSWLYVVINLYNNVLSGMLSLILMALIFLSNAFVNLNNFPLAIRVIAQINPITHAISAFSIMANGGNILNSETVISLGVIAVILIIFIPLSVKVFNRKMR